MSRRRRVADARRRSRCCRCWSGSRSTTRSSSSRASTRPGSAERAQPRARGGPVIATAGAGHGGRASSRCCSRPCRWCAAFGALLVLGIVLAFAVTLTAGFALLAGDRRSRRRSRRSPLAPVAGRGSPAPHGSRRGSPSAAAALRALGAGAAARFRAARCGGSARVRARRVAARSGWPWSAGSRGTQVEVVSDVERLRARRTSARCSDAAARCERETGSSGRRERARARRTAARPARRRAGCRATRRASCAGTASSAGSPAARPSCARRSRSRTCSASGRADRAPGRGRSSRAAALLLAERDHAPTAAPPTSRSASATMPLDRAEGADRRHARPARPAARA